MYVNFTTKLEQFSISDTLSTSSLTIIFYKGFLQHYYRIIEKNTDGKGFQRPSCTISYSKHSPLWLGFLGWCPPEFRYCQKQRTHNLSRHLPHLFDNQYNENHNFPCSSLQLLHLLLLLCTSMRSLASSWVYCHSAMSVQCCYSGGSKYEQKLHMWSHKSWVGDKVHFTRTAGCPFANPSKYVDRLHCCKGALLTPIQLALHLDLQSYILQNCFLAIWHKNWGAV